MNILFLNSIEKGTYGGMEEWTRLVARSLVERGHRVTVAGRTGSEYIRRAVSEHPRIRQLELDISGDFNPVTITTLKQYMARNDVDVVVVNFNKDIRLGGLAARWEHRPSVVWSVGLDITKDNPVHRFLTPRLIDGVMVPSQSLKNQITKFGYVDPAIVEVIPNATDDRDYVAPGEEARVQLRERYGLPESATIAVNVGRYVNQKGHTFLIEAAKRILKRFDEIVFLLVGDGPLRSSLESQIAQVRLEDHFVLTGMVDRVDGILAGADLMVHSAVEEPFGFALIEGMRAALPIVAPAVGGIPEVVVDGETGLLVEPRNPQALAEAVVTLLGDRARMQALGQAGFQRWEAQFRLGKMVDRVESYLGRFVKQGVRHGLG
ncbi:MAG: glycosyltransferase family 4 protein [Candidatus Zixiibacteriota bacterium]